MNTPNRAAAAACLLSFLAAIPALASDTDSEAAKLVAELGLHESAVPARDRPGWAPPKKVVLMGADETVAARMREVAPGVTIVAPADRAAAAREAADADVLIGECVPEVIAAGTQLRWVQRT